MKDTVKQILKQYGSDRNRLMDILIDIQEQLGYIPSDAIVLLAANLGMSQVDVEQTISFYHFSAQSHGENTLSTSTTVPLPVCLATIR